MADKNYPVSKAQQTVLSVLEMTAIDYTDADQKLAELGITVASKRGIPVVRYHEYYVGLATQREAVKKLAQWMEKA